jgi:hypothetical protein
MQLRPSIGNSDPDAKPRRSRLDSGEGIDFVRCHICGKHLRVISGSHLRIHGIEREAYMLEYHLSPDELCAKESRKLHSRRRDYRPYGKRDWIAAIKKLYKRDGKVFAGHLQRNNPHLYSPGVWLFGSWNNALRAAGFTPDKMRLWAFWDQEKLIKQIQSLSKKNLPVYALYVMKHYPTIFSAANRQCGSWNNRAECCRDNDSEVRAWQPSPPINSVLLSRARRVGQRQNRI